jgi:hypothetical protein
MPIDVALLSRGILVAAQAWLRRRGVTYSG